MAERTSPTSSEANDTEILEIRCALEELQIPVTIVESVSAVIEFVKGFLLRRGFQISPLTEELLDTLDALLRAHVRKIMLANDPLVKSVMEAKKKTQSRLRQLEYMLTYDKHNDENLADFMSRMTRDSLDSNSSSDSGRGTINDDQQEGMTVELEETQTKAGDVFDEAFVTSQISKIKDSLPSDLQSLLEPWLARLESYAKTTYKQALCYQSLLEGAIHQLERIDMRVDSLFGKQHNLILESRGQFSVCGIISFVENEIFRQHPTYTKLLSETVATYCMEKGISAAMILPDELRRLKWRTAAEDKDGANVLNRLGEINCFLKVWTADDMASFITRLASSARKRSWVGFDGQPTVCDEIKAAEIDSILHDYAWKGYGTPAMFAICEMIDVPFSLEKKFSWFRTRAMNECRKAWMEEGSLKYDKLCEKWAVCMKERTKKSVRLNSSPKATVLAWLRAKWHLFFPILVTIFVVPFASKLLLN